MLKFVGFQTIVILDHNGMTYDAVSVFGTDFWLLFKFGLSYVVVHLFPSWLVWFGSEIKCMLLCPFDQWTSLIWFSKVNNMR